MRRKKMHGLPTIHKLNDAEARRIMEEHGCDTSEWANPNPLGYHDVNPVRVVDANTETFDQPEGE